MLITNSIRMRLLLEVKGFKNNSDSDERPQEKVVVKDEGVGLVNESSFKDEAETASLDSVDERGEEVVA